MALQAIYFISLLSSLSHTHIHTYTYTHIHTHSIGPTSRPSHRYSRLRPAKCMYVNLEDKCHSKYLGTDRPKFMVNVISAPWSEIESPNLWSSKILILMLRTLCHVSVHTCQLLQYHTVTGAKFVRLSLPTIDELITDKNDRDIIVKVITGLRRFWNITDPGEPLSRLDPMAGPPPQTPKKKRNLEAFTNTTQRAMSTRYHYSIL